MRNSRKLSANCTLFAVVIVLTTSWLLSGVAVAQGTQGQNAVFNSSGTCSQCAGSSAFIDASTFVSVTYPDICAVINHILASGIVPSNGGVIDARGISGSALTCSISPWSGISNPPPSTILLPPGTIVTSAIWVLPSNTHLIGEGDNDPLSSTPGTTIQVNTGTSIATMMQFGSSSVCSGGTCTGISVERLTLDGQAQAVDGIVNQFSQTNTFVDHVTLYQILGAGLVLSTSGSSSANMSGPYSNITFDTGHYSGSSSTVCVQISGLSATNGIRKLSCTSETHDGLAAVVLDSSNTLIKDATITGFYAGVQVGANATAEGNVLTNIVGDTTGCTPTCLTPVETVHISSNTTSGNPNVTDLSIMGVSNSGISGTYSVRDDLTSTDLIDAYIAMYVLGRPLKNEGSVIAYTRYTTSPNAVSWSFGGNYPQGSCVSGSLFSCLSSSTGSTCEDPNHSNAKTAFWECSSGTWKGII